MKNLSLFINFVFIHSFIHSVFLKHPHFFPRNRAMGSSPQGINSLERETEGCGASVTDPGENTMLQRTWVSTNSCGHSAYEKLGEEASDDMTVIPSAKQ